MEFVVGQIGGLTNNPLAERVIRLGGTAGELAVVIRDRLQGRIVESKEPAFIDKKGLELALEQVVGKTPALGSVLEVLFSGQKTSSGADLPPGIGPTGLPRAVTGAHGEGEQLPPVVMLPMWNADP